jgi:hypothetical protein
VGTDEKQMEIKTHNTVYEIIAPYGLLRFIY